MSSLYYSGQGSLYIATRSAGGKPEGFIPVGNVPELTLDIETTEFEHKESETGSRLLDLKIIKEKKGKFNFKLEDLNLDNLALGLWGTKSTISSGTVTSGSPEVITIAQASAGRRYPLAHPNVSAVTVKNSAGTVTYVLNTDYTLDTVNGVITPKAGGAIATAVASAPADIKVDYSYGAALQVDAFTQASAPERWLRFEGINTVDNKSVIVDIFRAQFDPLTGYGLLNDDLGSVSMKGSILADTLQQGASKFFKQTNVS